MDGIKILVIDCQRTIFLGFLIATAKKVSMGKHAHTVGFRNCCRLFLRPKSQSVTHGSVLSMSEGKVYYFMKILYFSQLCEQSHVNQFSHNFKENEQIFDLLK